MSADVVKRRRRLIIKASQQPQCESSSCIEKQEPAPKNREKSREFIRQSESGRAPGERSLSPLTSAVDSRERRLLCRCLARTWSGGAGKQCSRTVMCPSSDYCTQHQQQAESENGLSHGRIDESMPAQKATLMQPHARVRCPRVGHAATETSRAKSRDSCPKPILDYDRCRCAARVWAGGRGSQCMRKVSSPDVFCASHQRDHESQNGLAHGRIDEVVPDAKVEDFLNAQHVLDSWSSESFSSSSSFDSDLEDTHAERDERHVYTKRAVRSTQQFVLPEVCCIIIFECLAQSAVFRSAMVCSLWNDVIQNSHQFLSLDLRSVGIWLTTRGRRTTLTAESREMALWSFVSQNRFSKVRKLDLRGVMMGRESPDRNEFLEHIARWCPFVRHILLHHAEPHELWSDLNRFMPASFARSLLRWWPGIAEEKMMIECNDRLYIIGGTGSSPRVKIL